MTAQRAEGVRYSGLLDEMDRTGPIHQQDQADQELESRPPHSLRSCSASQLDPRLPISYRLDPNNEA